MELLIANPGHKGKRRVVKRRRVVKQKRVLGAKKKSRKVRRNPAPLRKNHTKDMKEDFQFLGMAYLASVASFYENKLVNLALQKTPLTSAVRQYTSLAISAGITGGLYWSLSKSSKTKKWAAPILVGGGLFIASQLVAALKRSLASGGAEMPVLTHQQVAGLGSFASDQDSAIHGETALSGGLFEGSSI